jgi:predicted nucleic acid-binding protein
MPALPLLDTNPLIRHLLDHHAAHSPRAHALFARIEGGAGRVRTTDTVLFELVYTLEGHYKVPRPEIRGVVLDLLRIPGIVLPGKRAYRRIFEALGKPATPLVRRLLLCDPRRRSQAACYHQLRPRIRQPQHDRADRTVSNRGRSCGGRNRAELNRVRDAGV